MIATSGGTLSGEYDACREPTLIRVESKWRARFWISRTVGTAPMILMPVYSS